MRKRPKAALLIESSRAYGRRLMRDIAAYVRTHRLWSIYVEPHELERPPLQWIRAWDGDGILSRVTDRRTLELLRATGLPTIDLRGSLADTYIPLVGLDSRPATIVFGRWRGIGVKPSLRKYTRLSRVLTSLERFTRCRWNPALIRRRQGVN